MESDSTQVKIGFVNRITEVIENENKGKLSEFKDLGKKKLAYEIRKNTEGRYILFEFACNSELISELERVYRITTEVIKFVVVRKDEE